MGNHDEENDMTIIRTYREVEAFCERKYGTPFPKRTEFGELKWLHVPYFGRPYTPSNLHGIPRLRVEWIVDGSPLVEWVKLTREQLSLLGINFDAYSHITPEKKTMPGSPIWLDEEETAI